MIIADDEGGYPGSHGRNWSPAETFDDYVRNCREGLETWSDRRVAKLLGVSRMTLRQARLFAELPDELFEALLADARRQGKKASARDFVYIALALRGQTNIAEVERCPHCGGLLRIRGISETAAAVVVEWLKTRKAG